MIKEIFNINDRLDKLEEESNYDPYKQIDYNPLHEEIDLNTTKSVKSADKMLKELGYIKVRDDNCGTHIIIYSTKSGYDRIWFRKEDDNQYSYLKVTDAHHNITKDEDKAIHKKIEELKGEQDDRKRENK